MNSNVTLYPPQIVMTISTDYFPKTNRNSGILQVVFLKHADFCTLIEKLFLFICPSFRSGYHQSRQEWSYTQQLDISTKLSLGSDPNALLKLGKIIENENIATPSEEEEQKFLKEIDALNKKNE